MAMGKGMPYNRSIMGGFKMVPAGASPPNNPAYLLPLIRRAPYIYPQYKGI